MTSVVVVGVSASGKTTVGLRLASRLAWRYVDGDDLHPAANVAKMRGGAPLDDADRWPWLSKVASVLDEPGDVVVACSALRRAYRDYLRDGRPSARIVYLAADRALIAQRLAARGGHFFPAELLDSQFATLEEPTAGEGALTVDASKPPEAIVNDITTWFKGT